jgi:hypothetical protein
MPYHSSGSKRYFALYQETNADFVDGKMIFYREAQF